MSDELETVALATELTIAWISNPNTRSSADDVPAFLTAMHSAVANLAQGNAQPATTIELEREYLPAVSVRKSLASKDHIISLIDGKPYRTLRRHLSTHGLTPEGYRTRYGLKADYPMVAEAYSESRRALAKAIGLGRKAGTKVEKAAEGAVKKTRKRGKAALAAARATLGGEG